MRPPEVYTTTPYSSDWKVMKKFCESPIDSFFELPRC
jgi:hypothetical protein